MKAGDRVLLKQGTKRRRGLVMYGPVNGCDWGGCPHEACVTVLFDDKKSTENIESSLLIVIDADLA